MLPALAHEAIVIAADPEATITRLSRVVSKDPALATRVLHLANSAYSAPLQTVTTLTDAIVRMGTSPVRSLVIAACLASRGSDANMYGPGGRQQIDHAIGTAYMAHIAAERIGWSQDEAFLAGLLHDIGKLLLLKLARDYEKLSGNPVEQDELNALMTEDHAATGATLLKSMRFPRYLVETVAWHHDPQQAPLYQRQAAVVYFADRLSHRYGFGCDPDETPLIDDPVTADLTPSEEWIQSIDSRAAGLYAVARRILD
jgi:putative nucleotidyltransferase with HDIG domain